MAKRKGKRKIRIVYRDKLSGRFIRKVDLRRKTATAKRVPILRKKPAKKTAAKSKRKSAKRKTAGKLKPAFTRQIKLQTQPETVRETVYDIPFTLETQTVDGKRKKVFVPSFGTIKAVFDLESKFGRRRKKTFDTAACKINVIFRDDDSRPEDSDTWITIPIGRRIPVDEPGGAEEMFAEVMKYLLSYDVWAINVIQLSILRLPI